MKKRIVISINTAWNIHNFRSGLIKELIANGYDVFALAPSDGYEKKLAEIGCKFFALPIDSNRTRIWRDLLLFVRYYFILRKIRPTAFLGYTIKPNIYGSLAARALGIPVINNIAGLGATFIKKNYLTSIVMILYRLSLRGAHRVYFQNNEDLKLFVGSGLVKEKLTDLVPGSGVDLTRYVVVPTSSTEARPFNFLFVGRVLKDKGVQELVEAARIVKRAVPGTRFQILGPADKSNSNAIPPATIQSWQLEGVVDYLGATDDVRPFLLKADCVVLPSYREGVPKSLLEACAMARPIVASDVAGCRDAVDDGINGLLCQVRSAEDLAEKMLKVMNLTDDERFDMGQAGRRKVEFEFDERLVIAKYLYSLELINSDDEVASPSNRLVKQD